MIKTVLILITLAAMLFAVVIIAPSIIITDKPTPGLPPEPYSPSDTPRKKKAIPRYRKNLKEWRNNDYK